MSADLESVRNKDTIHIAIIIIETIFFLLVKIFFIESNLDQK